MLVYYLLNLSNQWPFFGPSKWISEMNIARTGDSLSFDESTDETALRGSKDGQLH